MKIYHEIHFIATINRFQNYIMKRLVVCSFVMMIISAKDPRGGIQPRDLKSARKVSSPSESGSTGQDVGILDCPVYSDCYAYENSCSCDNLCSMYNDCCMNAPPRKEGPTSLSDLSRYMTCRKWSGHHIWVVTECPIGSNETCSSEGEEFSSLSNTLVTDELNITYSNHRCAQCHGVSKFSYWTFLITHGSTPDSPCNASTDIVCDDLENSTEICLNTLLEKKCNVITYPPKGTSVRYCIETEKITNNMSCDSEYLPILNKKAWKLYRNIDCCAKLEGDCTGKNFICWTKPRNTFALGSRTFVGHPSYTVFSFAKKSNGVSFYSEVQFYGIKFELNVRFLYRTISPDEPDRVAVVCLLMKYFEVMEDGLSVVDGRIEMWKTSAAYPYSVVALKLRLQSRSRFTRKKDIQNVKDHLGRMMFSVYVNDKEDRFVMENIGEEATDFTVSALAKEVTRISNKFISDWFSVLKNKVCESVQGLDTRVIPFPRCNHLNISVNIDEMNADVVYKCLKYATPSTPGSISSGAARGVVFFGLGINVLCLLPTMGLASIFLV